nr:ATP-binding protein [Micromonospora sp. DSM 115978]
MLTRIGAHRFRLHDLLRLYAAERAEADEPPADVKAALTRMFDWYLVRSYDNYRKILPQGRPIPGLTGVIADGKAPFETLDEALRWSEQERLNVLDVIRLAQKTGHCDVTWKLAVASMAFFERRSYWRAWIDSHLLAVSCTRHLADRSAEGWVLLVLGDALWEPNPDQLRSAPNPRRRRGISGQIVRGAPSTRSLLGPWSHECRWYIPGHGVRRAIDCCREWVRSNFEYGRQCPSLRLRRDWQISREQLPFEQRSSMVYLKRVTVDNLVGREESIDIVFERDLNVLWGLNGSGKTSLLRIIDSALRNNSAAIANVPFSRAVVEFYSESYDTVITREITRPEESSELSDSFASAIKESDPSLDEHTVQLLRQLNKAGQPSNWTLSSDKKFTPKRPELRFARVYLPTSRLNTPMKRAGTLGKPDDLDTDFADQIERIWNLYNARSLQEIDALREQGIASILSAILTRSISTGSENSSDVSPDRAYELVRRYALSQRHHLRMGRKVDFLARYGDDPVLREVVSEIVKVQEKIEQAREPQRTIESLLSKFYSLNKRVSFEAGGVTVSLGEKQIPLGGLSSGERQILYILLQCLASNGSVIMIDEPELSMHVDWQHEIVSAMRAVAPESQLVLATHSPEVMAEIPDRKIFGI